MKVLSILCFIIAAFLVTHYPVTAQEMQKENKNDSIVSLIRSIIDSAQKLDFLNAFAMLYDDDMPERWYVLFRIDTFKETTVLGKFVCT